MGSAPLITSQFNNITNRKHDLFHVSDRSVDSRILVALKLLMCSRFRPWRATARNGTSNRKFILSYLFTFDTYLPYRPICYQVKFPFDFWLVIVDRIRFRSIGGATWRISCQLLKYWYRFSVGVLCEHADSAITDQQKSPKNIRDFWLINNKWRSSSSSRQMALRSGM